MMDIQTISIKGGAACPYLEGLRFDEKRVTKFPDGVTRHILMRRLDWERFDYLFDGYEEDRTLFLEQVLKDAVYEVQNGFVKPGAGCEADMIRWNMVSALNLLASLRISKAWSVANDHFKYIQDS